jgi:formate dehydrogenase iron-sulfur subunit
MTLSLPILGEAIDELTNAFPPRRTPVPQPGDVGAIMGFFTDTTLCIGCKACEVACKQWNQLPADQYNFTGYSYDNTGHLGATTWRHVKFKEQIGETAGRWLMMSDVCKHCESAPCQHSCPTGAIIYNDFGDVYVQNDICNGCGYCVSACPFGVLGRAEGQQDDGHAHKCTLCFDRQSDDMTPACAKACPTASIQFGPVTELRDRARGRVTELQERGNQRAYLYGADSVGDYGPLNAFFLLEDHPNEYNLPENPPQPFKGQAKRYATSLLTGVALTALAAAVFGRRRE